MYPWWGLDVYTPVAYVSAIVVGADTPENYTLGDYAAIVGLWTFGGGGVGGVWVYGVGSMQYLYRFTRSLIFSLGRGGTVVNW